MLACSRIVAFGGLVVWMLTLSKLVSLMDYAEMCFCAFVYHCLQMQRILQLILSVYKKEVTIAPHRV